MHTARRNQKRLSKRIVTNKYLSRREPYLKKIKTYELYYNKDTPTPLNFAFFIKDLIIRYINFIQMETLERLDMETTKNIRGEELPPSLRKQFNVRSRDHLTVTVKVRDNEECDVESVGEALIEGFSEILEMKKKGIKPQNAREFLNSL